MLPKNTILGQLEMFEVYEYLDGPRLFAARNNIGTTFLVYWFDEIDDATGWLYLPISDKKLAQLRRKGISLNAAYQNPEAGYFKVYTNTHPEKDLAEPITHEEIDVSFFPPEDYYIEYAEVIKQTDEWSFKAVLKGKTPSAEALTQFIGRLHELIEYIMNDGKGDKIKLYAQGVSSGSLVVNFRADSDDHATKALKILEKLLSSNKDEFHRQIINNKINSSQLKELLTSIKSKNLDVEIEPRLASGGEILEFSVDKVDQWLEYLDDLNFITVDSINIPQANDIDKVLRVIKMIEDGIDLVPENLDNIAPREIKYYVDAAYAFGLITKDKQLTAAGHFINSRAERKAQYEILADRFESTDFGWAWMTWAKVQYMTELDPETAVDFLSVCVPGLNRTTAVRRSSTLRKWLKLLQQYHRRYMQK